LAEAEDDRLRRLALGLAGEDEIGAAIAVDVDGGPRRIAGGEGRPGGGDQAARAEADLGDREGPRRDLEAEEDRLVDVPARRPVGEAERPPLALEALHLLVAGHDHQLQPAIAVEVAERPALVADGRGRAREVDEAADRPAADRQGPGGGA